MKKITILFINADFALSTRTSIRDPLKLKELLWIAGLQLRRQQVANYILP